MLKSSLDNEIKEVQKTAEMHKGTLIHTYIHICIHTFMYSFTHGPMTVFSINV